MNIGEDITSDDGETLSADDMARTKETSSSGW